LSTKEVQMTVSLVCKNWLEIVRNDTKHLKLGEVFLRRYFQVEDFRINNENLNTLMTTYLKLWPNVQKIEMYWFAKTPLQYCDFKDSPKWLDSVRKGVKVLQLDELKLKKCFQLETFMGDYLELWPNVERIVMNWIGTKTISRMSPQDDKAKWLDMARKKVKFLKLKEQSMKEYFQLDKTPINNGLLNSLMNDYLKAWPNVEEIEMDWIATISLSNLPANPNIKQLWNAPNLKFLTVEEKRSTNTGPIIIQGVAQNGTSWSYSSSSSSKSTCTKTFRF